VGITALAVTPNGNVQVILGLTHVVVLVSGLIVTVVFLVLTVVLITVVPGSSEGHVGVPVSCIFKVPAVIMIFGVFLGVSQRIPGIVYDCTYILK